MTAKKIALFIDADNVSAKFGKKIIEALENRGELFIRRIYGNWEKFSLHGWNDCILNYSLRAVQQPDFVTGKNATDMSLTIDAMDVLHEGKAEIFALVSNDSDFTPLVIRLREGGMFIIGIGNANASNAFRAACSEFIDLNSLAEVKIVQPKKVESKPPVKKITPAEKISPVEKVSPPAKVTPLPAEKISPAPEKKSSVQLSLFDAENSAAVKPPPPPPPKISNPKVVPITVKKNRAVDSRLQKLHDVLRETVALRGDDKGFVALCWAGQSIREKNLGFGVKDFGYGSLHAFVNAFPDLYEVINRDNGENFCYRCLVDPPKRFTRDDMLGKLHKLMRKAADNHKTADGFISLVYAGTAITQKKLGFGVKNLGYGTLQKFVADFPDLYELRRDNNGISYRCRVDEPKEIPAFDNPEQLHELLSEAAKLYAAADDFVDLWRVNECKKISDDKTKELSYKEWFDFVSSFPDRYDVRRDLGNNFHYRCRTADTQLADNPEQLHELLCEATKLYAAADGFVDLRRVNECKKISDAKELSCKEWFDFVSSFPDRYEVRKTANDIFYRCRVDEPKEIPADARIAKLHEVLRATAATRADESGFADLSYAGNSIGKQKIGFGIRSLGYSTLQKFVADFPDRYEIKKVSHKVFYRCHVEDVQPADKPKELRLPADDKTNQLHKLLQGAAKNFSDDDDFVNLLRACDYILIKENVNRDIKEMTYPQLSDFVAEFPDRYEIRKTANDIFYRCRVVTIETSADKVDQLHEILREASKVYADAKGLVRLKQVYDFICDNPNVSGEIKSISFAQLNDFVADFPDLYNVCKTDNGTFYRCRGLQLPADKSEQLHELLRGAANNFSDAEGFVQLKQAHDFICGNANVSDEIKRMSFGQLRDFVSSFPDLYAVIRRDTNDDCLYRCREPQISAEEKLNRLHDVLLAAEEIYADDKGFVSMWDLGKYITEKISDRELRELSYKDLFEFVSEFPDRYEVIEPDKNVFCYRRRTAEQKFSDDDKLNRLHEVLRESAQAHGDEAGFSLLNHAGTALKSKKLGFGIKDFGYHQLRDFVDAFPDLYETAQDQAGKNFRYRCKQFQKL